jgi:hypothetical protein
VGVVTVNDLPFIHTYQPSGGSGNNLFMGKNSGNFTMTAPVLDSGSANTGYGDGTLSSLTTGVWNTAVGYLSQAANTGGGQNTSIGVASLKALTLGTYNCAVGDGNSWKITTGYGNNSMGYHSLDKVTVGSYNVALGHESMFSSPTGTNNVALGAYAIYSGASGNHNTDVGYQTRFFNTLGDNNTTLGAFAMWNANTPTGGVAIGYSAGRYATNSYEVYVDNRDRTSSALEKANALIWGQTAAAAANQTLTINANLGLGTNAPGEKVDVVGNVQATGAVVAKSTAAFALYAPNGGVFSGGTVNNFMSGNLGIGILTPGTRLSVSNAPGTTGTPLAHFGTNNTGNGFFVNTNGTGVAIGSRVPAATLDVVGSLAAGPGRFTNNVEFKATALFTGLAASSLLYNDSGTEVAAVTLGGGHSLSTSLLTHTNLIIANTTNQIVFGATNIAPASAVAPTKWISVQVAGESVIYRLPLYQ